MTRKLNYEAGNFAGVRSSSTLRNCFDFFFLLDSFELWWSWSHADGYWLGCYINRVSWPSIMLRWFCHTAWIMTHCSKPSLFVQKSNFDFPRKLSIFWVKHSWKCCGFGLFSCWQLWFHEKNCQKKFGRKTRENVGVLSKLNFWTKIWLFE